jgi:uncharacterized membrane-anchored protein YhcB (DUF1043 family)
MKIFRAGFLNLLVLTFVVSLESPALARAEVIVTPKAVTLNATKGAVETRILTLRTSETISNLRPIALDSYSADGGIVLPAKSIQITSPPQQVSAGELVSFPVKFDLRAASSGEFTGEILLTYQGGDQVIPVIVRVKEPWLWPLITLLLGVGLGMAVSAYSSQGKLSDEVTVSLENLRTQIDPDREQARSFWSRSDMHLVVAKQALDAKQLEDAKSTLADARATWNKWLRQRPNWLIQFGNYDTLRQRLNQDDLKGIPAIYIQTIDRDLEDTLQSTPDFASPDDLQKKLDELSQQLNFYIRLTTQLNKLRDLIALLEGEQRYDWEDKADEIAQQLNTLLASQETELKELQQEIKTNIEEVKKLVSEAAQTYDVTKSIDGGGATEQGLVLQPPPVRKLPVRIRLWMVFSSLWQTAKGRLRLFYLSSYLISFIVLAGGGFNQLYITKPTFGANGWGDYFALLAWGFGAEATRKIVTQVAGKGNEPTS